MDVAIDHMGAGIGTNELRHVKPWVESLGFDNELATLGQQVGHGISVDIHSHRLGEGSTVSSTALSSQRAWPFCA
jgi:hypothetical protein